jgi:hypothetical protein
VDGLVAHRAESEAHLRRREPDPWPIIEWLAENVPRALELCPYKVALPESNPSSDPVVKRLHDELQMLAAEIVLYRRLVSAHHAVGVMDDALIGDPCPVCAEFEKRAEQEINKLIVEG